MNRGGWILLIGAAALAAAVVAMATRERARSPEEDLRVIADRMKKGRLDREEALSELDHLVDRTLESGDSGIAARIRLARGRILMDIDALDRAREDFQVVLGLGVLPAKEARDVEDDLIDLDIRAGKFVQGLERVKVLIDRDPNDATAWSRKGEMHHGMAERGLDRARELLGNRLLADTAARARKVLDRLGAMDPADPRRPAVGRDLSALFDPGDEKHSQQVLRSADQAARENEQARAAFATSLSDLAVQHGRGSALAGLIDLLDRAGRSEEAAQLGTCALRTMYEEDDTDAIARMVGVLDRLGRKIYASDLGRWLVDRGAPIAPQRLLQMCDLFYRAGRWNELQQSTARLSQIGNADEVSKAGLYAGLVQVHLGAYATGRFALEKWVMSNDPEPFEGARLEAWRQIAQSASHLHLVDEEIDALENAVQLDPENSGPSLLRLASLQFLSPHGGYRGPEERWAKAMSLMPERTEELSVRWMRMGDQELKSEGLSRAGVLRDPNWRRIRSVPNSASLYQVYVLADVLLDAGQPAAAEPFARRLVQALPTFVPGLDLAIRAEQSLGRTNEVLGLLLARMRAAGADAKSRGILSRVPVALLSPEMRLQFMSADPEGFGRREIAREFLERGEPEVALALVGDAQGPNTVLEARLVAARACLETDRPDRAFELLLPLGRKASSRADSFDLFARAAARSGHREELLRTTMRAAAGLFPRKKEWLSLCDTLLALGDAGSAMPLIKRLDSDRRTRGGEVLLRRAWAELLLGNEAGLRQTLGRAQAFDTQGAVELVGVLACSQTATDGAVSALPEALETLRKTTWRPSRLQETAILVLEGKKKAARSAIGAALTGDPVEPLWVLADALLAAEEGRSVHPAPASFGADAERETSRFAADVRARDPRLLWCVLLVQSSAPAAGWIEGRIAGAGTEEPPHEPSLWPAWISTRLARARGDRAIEWRLLEKLVARWPGFEPAWDRLEEVARALGKFGQGIGSVEAMEDLRERRLHGLGLRAGTRPQINLEIARIQRRNRDLDAALESARKALEEDPSSPEVRAELGRIHSARGEWKAAVESSVRASRMDTRASDARTTGDLVQALAGAGRVVPPALTAEERLLELEALQAREPDDPRVPVALAWMDLETDPRNPTIAVSKAYARLDRFLETHKDVALETLCAGADAAWTDLLVSLDPERARAFLKGEQLRIPSRLEPWLQLGRVAAAENPTDSDTDELDLVRRMAPIPRILREHARVRLARAPTLTEIGTLTRDIRRAEGRKELDGELSLLVGQALFDVGPRGTQAALNLASRLASSLDLSPESSAEAKLLRAEALIALGRTGQADEARAILTDLRPGITDPYRGTLALACAGLAVALQESSRP